MYWDYSNSRKKVLRSNLLTYLLELVWNFSMCLICSYTERTEAACFKQFINFERPYKLNENEIGPLIYSMF